MPSQNQIKDAKVGGGTLQKIKANHVKQLKRVQDDYLTQTDLSVVKDVAKKGENALATSAQSASALPMQQASIPKVLVPTSSQGKA